MRKPNQPSPTIDGPPAGSGGCLGADTLVSTPAGPRRINTLQSGDLVKTPNGDKKITKVRKHFRDNLVELDLGDNEPIRCSAEHPFLNANRELVEAQQLGQIPGSLIITADDAIPATIRPVEGKLTVYELILESDELIYVGESQAASRPTKEA